MRAYFGPTFAWAVGMILLPCLVQLGIGPPRAESWTVWQAAYLLLGWIGLLLPYTSFAGGVAVHRHQPVRSVAFKGTLVAALAFGLLAYGSPLALYKADAARGVDMSSRYPLGPHTFDGFLRLRSALERSPPISSSYSAEQPLSLPPNWVTFQIHSLLAICLFAVLSALLGWQVGFLTSGLSPPTRANARWAAGLACGVICFIVEAAGGEWVQADPSNSGLLGAWLPVLLPVFGVAGLWLLAVRRKARLHISSTPYV